jgi:hypothetical protein
MLSAAFPATLHLLGPAPRSCLRFGRLPITLTRYLVAASKPQQKRHRVDGRAGVVLAGACPKPRPFAIDNQVPPGRGKVDANLLSGLTFIRE